MNILMLDLEGVLILSALSPRTPMNIRPYAHEFLLGCDALFHQIWMNTCAREKETLWIMNDWFGMPRIRYWHGAGGRKTVGYERFKEDTLIHAEDGINDAERSDIESFGFHYVRVRPYTFYNKTRDDELMKRLDDIRKILQR